jgi:membrane-associated phospholipid phosphatase
MRGVWTYERLWVTYLSLVLAVAALTDGGGAHEHAPVMCVGIHLVLLALLGLHWVAARRGNASGTRQRRALMALVFLPVVFSALSLLLPAVHPEPWEYRWYEMDLACCGGDVSALALAATPSWALLPLQLIYAAFYFVPIAAGLAVAAARGGVAFDRAVVLLVGSFLFSYLGYLLFPTLAPKVVLPGDSAPLADGFGAAIRAWIDAAELNPWDCFPSGHTMLSLTSVLVVHRWARRLLPWFLLVVVPLIASTVVLRYHWPIDVVAGALLCWPTARALDWLQDRDGQPAAPAGP